MFCNKIWRYCKVVKYIFLCGNFCVLFDYVLLCLIILGKIYKLLDIFIVKLFLFKIFEVDNLVIVGLKENIGEKWFKVCVFWCENYMGFFVN